MCANSEDERRMAIGKKDGQQKETPALHTNAINLSEETSGESHRDNLDLSSPWPVYVHQQLEIHLTSLTNRGQPSASMACGAGLTHLTSLMTAGKTYALMAFGAEPTHFTSHNSSKNLGTNGMRCKADSRAVCDMKWTPITRTARCQNLFKRRPI
jgi:hypothetical protein